ncbi:MAG: type II secretion system F family protein [Raoultibacter sp.]
MATKILKSATVSTYCDGIALMLASGIQTDEAVHLLSENMQDPAFKNTCDTVYRGLIAGKPLSASMQQAEVFPPYSIEMIASGEFSGHLEKVLRGLATYYDEEDRLFARIKSAITYPAALLTIMTIILLFTVAVILPVFANVYNGLSGGLTTGSHASVNASLIIGWAAFTLLILCTLAVVIGAIMTRSQNGRIKLLQICDHLPIARRSFRQMDLSRFTSALSVYIAAGVNADSALTKALILIDHEDLQVKLERAHREMTDPDHAKNLAQAIFDSDIYDPIYARMLVVGTRSGSLDVVLKRLSEALFDESIARVDTLIDSVEPALAAFLTVSVGATLISVMLPLIGIMGSIG